jgi:hypothetical protein
VLLVSLPAIIRFNNGRIVAIPKLSSNPEKNKKITIVLTIKG